MTDFFSTVLVIRCKPLEAIRPNLAARIIVKRVEPDLDVDAGHECFVEGTNPVCGKE